VTPYRRGACKVCGHVVALRVDGRLYKHWTGFTPANRDHTCKGWGQLPKELKRMDAKIRATCRECSRSVALLKDGRIGRHGVKGVWPPRNCPGWGQMPKDDDA
jgi:hypothetical protein